MSATTSIQWTDRTWNPVRGCELVSPGCVNCYAMKQAHRFSGVGQAYQGLTRVGSKGPIWTGEARPVVEMLDEPLRWKKPSRIFVNSMSDLFHEDVPDKFIGSVFGRMRLAHWHQFQILTKRAQRMQEWVAREMPEPLPNIWLGVSVEDQKRADERIPLLLKTPAAVRFLSCEPLLSDIELRLIRFAPEPNGMGDLEYRRRIDWVIVGGESGPGARTMRVEWAQGLVKQCRAADVPVFVKQLGAVPMERNALDFHQHMNLRDRKGGDPSEWPQDLQVRLFPEVNR